MGATAVMPAAIVPPVNADVTKAVRAKEQCWLHRVLVVAAWGVFAGFHAFVMLFFGASAYYYWVLPQRGEADYLTVYRIGMDSKHYGTISFSYSIIALIHGISLLHMVIASVKRRRFVFTWSGPASIDPSTNTSRGVIRDLRRFMWVAYNSLFSPTGFFGVNGPCFDLLLLLREAVETALQTNQAYRMSQFLSRVWINQFYVCLLVVNCWLLAILHTAFHHSATTRYFVTLLCDLMLDFVSSMVVTLVLIILYSNDFDSTSSNLFGPKWFNDKWQMNAINEFQIVFVSSWTDLASRLIFSLSMISNLNTLKRFVSLAVDPTSREREWRRRWTSIVAETQLQPVSTNAAISVLVRINAVARFNPRSTKIIRVTFAAWGATVLAFHIAAAWTQNATTCVLQLRPWGVIQPSCNLVLINCYSESIVGGRSDIHERLSELYPPSILKFVIHHCPALEMPPILQAFSSLQAVKMYNSSIAAWDQDAALVKSKHPEVTRFTVVRTQFAGGVLPPGLMADDFPPTLTAMTFIYTNIREIPDDLDKKWTRCSIFYLASGQLRHIPDVVVRLAPAVLTLPGNPIESVPKELFETPGMLSIDLANTAITALPSDVTPSSATTTFLNLDSTNISSFPAWIDDWIATGAGSSYRMSAASSPYCLERARIFAGEQTTFTTQSVGSRLMNAAVDNWDFLNQTVKCTPGGTFRYPVAYEDMVSALRP